MTETATLPPQDIRKQTDNAAENLLSATPDAEDHTKPDYASFIRIKKTTKKERGPDGQEKIKTRETHVLSEEGKKTAKKDYQRMAQGGFDALKQELQKLRQAIKDHDNAPAHDQLWNAEQRVYYARLLQSCELQLRNNIASGIKEEIATTNNRWQTVVENAAKKRRADGIVSETQRKFTKNSLATRIHKLREQKVEEFAQKFQKPKEEITDVIILAEQNIILQNPFIADAQEVFSAPDLEHYITQYLQLHNEPRSDISVDRALNAVRQTSSEQPRRRAMRAKVASIVVAAGTLFYSLTGNPGLMKTAEHAASAATNFAQEILVASQVASQRYTHMRNAIEGIFNVHTGLQDQVFKSEENVSQYDLPDAYFPPPVEEPLPEYGPPTNVAADVTAGMALEEARRCMTVKKFPSPEYKGTKFALPDMEVADYNDTPYAETRELCRKLFPGISEIDMSSRKILQATAPRSAEIPKEFREAHPDVIYAPYMNEQFVVFRQIDGTCFLTTIASIIATRLHNTNLAPMSPLAFAELVRLAQNERSKIVVIGQDAVGSTATPETTSASVQNLGLLNIQPAQLYENKVLKDQGISYTTTVLPEDIVSPMGLKLKIDNKELTPFSQEFWGNAGDKIADTYINLINKGENPIFITQVMKTASHAMAVVGVEKGTQGHPASLLVYEPANQGESLAGWDVLDALSEKSKWEHVPGTKGIWKIPLTEENIRAMNQADGNVIVSLGNADKSQQVSFIYPQTSGDFYHIMGVSPN